MIKAYFIFSKVFRVQWFFIFIFLNLSPIVLNLGVHQNCLWNLGVEGDPMQLCQHLSGWGQEFPPHTHFNAPKVILNVQLELRSTNFLSYGLFNNKLENEQRIRILTWWGGSTIEKMRTLFPQFFLCL